MTEEIGYEPRLPSLHFTEEGTSTDLILLIAPRGGGKTTLMVALSKVISEDPGRLFVISPVARIGELLGRPVNRWYGRQKDIEEKWLGVMQASRRQVVVVDEGDEYCTGSVQGKNGGYCSDALYRLVNYGRNPPWAIGMMWSCRGASDVTTNLIRAANVLFIGRTNEPNALYYIAELLGDRAWSDFIHDLPPFVFVVSAEGQFNGYIKVEAGEITWVAPPPGFPLPQTGSPGAGASTSEDGAQTPGSGASTAPASETTSLPTSDETLPDTHP